MTQPREAALQSLLDQHRLPPDYLIAAQEWFDPAVDSIALHQKGAERPILVGVNGSQGSGKTTLCDYLALLLRIDHGLQVAVMSLDDFYLTRTQRGELARTVHPLLLTRGVPGTHDCPLMTAVIGELLAGGCPRVPRFDKASDDRAPASQWTATPQAVDVVILEGWCMGVPPQDEAALERPINALEYDEDRLAQWRTYSNRALAEDYATLFDWVDYWLMLRAPSFDCVYRWRLEQEHKLAQVRSGSGVMTDDQVQRFIQHYQRLTEWGLSVVPSRVDRCYTLDENRQVLDCVESAVHGD